MGSGDFPVLSVSHGPLSGFVIVVILPGLRLSLAEYPQYGKSL